MISIPCSGAQRIRPVSSRCGAGGLHLQGLCLGFLFLSFRVLNIFLLGCENRAHLAQELQVADSGPTADVRTREI